MNSEQMDDEAQSISQCLMRLQGGDREAAELIWRRYFEKLLPIARSKLYASPDIAIDDEDILVSVFDRFFRAAAAGRFPRLDDRNDLWQVLLMLTDHKIRDNYRRNSANKRGPGRRIAPGTDFDLAQSAEVVDRGPSPEFVAEFNDQLSECLEKIGDGALREIACLKLEGYTNPEICKQLGLSLSGVERKLRLIRQQWEQASLR